jgi:lipopolysaccharide export system protein LptA
MTLRRITVSFIFSAISLFANIGKAQVVSANASTQPVQDSGKIIRIIKADRLTLLKLDGTTERYILAGNVQLMQDNTLFYCDSAVKDEALNTIEAFGNIHINDADSVHTYAQYLKYLGDSKLATLRQKVKLTDGKGVLTTEELQYDINARIGSYMNGGKVVNGNSVLTSRQGYYYADTKEVYFQDKVKLVDPEYTMSTDTLLYDLNKELATFVAMTTINDGRSRILTRSGFYDMKTGEAEFGKRPMIEDSSQQIVADSIKYDKKKGTGFASGNVRLKDTAQGITVLSGQAEFDQGSGRMLATMKPVMILKRDRDSLFIAADTLMSGSRPRRKRSVADTLSKNDSTQYNQPGVGSAKYISNSTHHQRRDSASSSIGIQSAKVDTSKYARHVPSIQVSAVDDSAMTKSDSVRYLLAYRHVRIFSDSLQGVCDSLSYSAEDSVFRFFQDPILWARASQITGDTILLFTKNQKPDQLQVLENGFSSSQTPESLFNQIRGNTLFGQFVGGEIDYLRAKGSAESLYYLQAEDSSYFGLNYAKADAISLYFINRELKRVTWVSGVEGVTYPFRQIPSDKKQLRGFKWLEDRRPKSRYVLFAD